MMYLMLIIGFVLLIKGADFFVDGSCALAKRLKVPSAIIGLTIVAIGTSLPETAVSVTAAIEGENAIAISNVVGSNLFNLMVVVGVCAMIKAFPINNDIVKRDFPLSMLFTVALLVMISDTFIFKRAENNLGRVDGIILLILLVMYTLLLVKSTLEYRANSEDSNEEIMSAAKSIIFIVIGIAGIKFGGDFVVNSASDIATSFHVTQTLIGLTIVALGTSLPELVTSIVASRKGENDLALGNVIGSNIFNLLLVLGVSATINPIGIEMTAIYDFIILIVFNVYAYLLIFKRTSLGKIGGASMVILYAFYMVYIIMR